MWINMFYFIALVIFARFLINVLSNEYSVVKFHSKFYILYMWTVIVTTLCIPFFMIRPKNVMNGRYGAAVVTYITPLIGIRWKIRGATNLSEERGAVIVANHQSTIDILGMAMTWCITKRQVNVAKKALLYFGPFGLSGYLCGTIYLDRSNSKDCYKKLNDNVDLVVKNKTKIWFFPEGTRNKHAGLLPFKTGAFKVAIAAGVPVLPLVISPYYFINHQKNHFGAGNVIIHCLDPVPTTGLTAEDAPMLTEKVRDLMLAEYQNLRKEVLSELPIDYPLADYLSS